MDKLILYIVVPCYNEEPVLPESARRLTEILSRLDVDPRSRILFVDDGSHDRTWAIIRALADKDARVSGVKLSHNRGQQNALWAGLMTARPHADCVISIDSDLQDDPEVIPQFLDAFRAGNDIVYGVRASRETDTAFKRNTAHMFYRFMQWLGVDVVYDHADYRLMSRRALDALSKYGEVNMFVRGIVSGLGFPHCTVPYERHERFAGDSKYPLKRMLWLAFQGITSFSDRPILWTLFAGLGVTGLAMLAMLICAICTLCGTAVSAGAWTLLSVWLLGGVNLSGIGLVGEYVAKTYLETKRRPKYEIEETVHVEA